MVVVVLVVAGDDVGRVDEGVKATVVGDFLLFWIESCICLTCEAVSRRISPFESKSVRILALPSLIILSLASPASGPATILSISGLMTLLFRVSVTRTAGRLTIWAAGKGDGAVASATDPTPPFTVISPLLAIETGELDLESTVVLTTGTAAVVLGFLDSKGVALSTLGPVGVI